MFFGWVVGVLRLIIMNEFIAVIIVIIVVLVYWVVCAVTWIIINRCPPDEPATYHSYPSYTFNGYYGYYIEMQPSFYGLCGAKAIVKYRMVDASGELGILSMGSSYMECRGVTGVDILLVLEEPKDVRWDKINKKLYVVDIDEDFDDN